MRGISQALIQRLRRADPTARTMVEAAVETSADIRQRYDQWNTNPGLDSIPADVELTKDGGVRLKATAAAGPQNSTHVASYLAFGDTGAVSPYFGPILNDGHNHIATLLNWKGSESDQVEMTKVEAYLDPQPDATKPITVTRWACQVYGIVQAVTSAQGTWYLQPLTVAPVYAPVTAAAGFIAFDFSAQPLRPKTTPKLPLGVDNAGDTNNASYTLIVIWGVTDPGGAPATNAGFGYDNGAASVVSAANSLMRGVKVQWPTAGAQTSSRVTNFGISSTVPTVKITIAAYTSDTVSFSDTGHTNHIDLGASIPKAQIELTCLFDPPPGTSVQGQVLNDAAVWQNFTDGQTLDQISGFASANYQTLKMRATLTTNSFADRTPTLRSLGAAAITLTDLSEVAWVPQASWAFDPLTHVGEVPTCTIQAIHDGERDFRDAITLLLSQNPIGNIKFRLWCGDKSLAKKDWLRLDDFLIDDYDLYGPHVIINCVSSLALIRGALPKLQSQVDAYPASDTSNPGAWTKVGGSTLAEVLADNNGGGNNLLPWQDTTYVQSVSNPVNADFTVALQGLSPPAKAILGQVIIPFRAYLSSGTSLTLIVYLMEGATQRYLTTLTIKATTVSSFLVTPDVASLASISDWTNLRLKFRANGTGQIRVTWARLSQLPYRSPLNYSNATPSSVVSDLLGNQVGLAARYRGPGLEGIDGLDTGTALALAKTIDQPSGGSTDLMIAKRELDAVGFISGAVFTSSQGRIAARRFFDVSVDAQGVVTYTPQTGKPPVAVIPMGELEPLHITPGFRYRVPEFFVDWNYNPTKGSYGGEARGFNATGLTTVGVARIVGITRARPEVAQWIPSQGLANGLANRQVAMFGLGLMQWRFHSTYAYPELELFDPVLIETERFVAYDPLAARAIAGAQWVTGLVCGIYDTYGHDIAIWVPTYSSIIGAGTSGPKQPDVPGSGLGDLVTNGNFEQGLVNWQTQLSGVGVSLESGGNVYLGAFSARLDAQNLNSAEIVQAAPVIAISQDGSGNNAIPVPLLRRVIPGSTIKVTGIAKILNGTARTGAVAATFYGPDGTPLSAETAVVSWSAETTYTAKTGTITVPANAYWVSFSIFCQESVSGTASLYIDEVHAYVI